MKSSFREFVNRTPFTLRLREDEAAPSIGGAPPAPSNPDSTTNKHHFDSLARGLGTDQEGIDAALEGGSITVWQVPNYYSKWGFLVSGPVDVSVEKMGDNYQLTYQLKAKQRMEPMSFYLPYKQGQRPMYYQGPVEDKTETVSSEELQDMMAVPFKNMPPGGAAMGGMGGAPGAGGPAGAGAPPMGGAPAGPAPAAPPMGGM